MLKPGDKNYKAYVGLPDRYDFMGATQFRLLTSLGLRAHHKLLDFGCGSLRAGKLFIPYLDAANYHGQDPNEWLIRDGIENELPVGVCEEFPGPVQTWKLIESSTYNCISE